MFSVWKKAKKALKKKKPLRAEELKLTVLSEASGTDEEILEKTAHILKTQPHHVGNTIRRFLKELDEIKERMKKE